MIGIYACSMIARVNFDPNGGRNLTLGKQQLKRLHIDGNQIEVNVRSQLMD